MGGGGNGAERKMGKNKKHWIVKKGKHTSGEVEIGQLLVGKCKI